MIPDSKTWQNSILALFQPKKEAMIVVIDPDNLLLDETLLAEIQNSSYDILKLEDEVAFRNRFERNYRSRWDSGEPRHVVIIVRTHERERHIPYDLLQKGKRIEVGVSQLFSNLNALVIKELDHAYYQDLYAAHQSLVTKHELQRGERQTVEFILRVVFGIEPVAALNPTRLAELLIDKHDRRRMIPQSVEQYLMETLGTKIATVGMTSQYLLDAESFYTWLGQQWEMFVHAQVEKGGPQSVIHFDDPQLKPLLPHLFSDGKLQRVAAPMSIISKSSWMAAGLQFQGNSGKSVHESIGDRDGYNLQAQINRLLALDSDALPKGKTDIRDWLNLAAEWAEIVFRANSLPQEVYSRIQPAFFQARTLINQHFLQFVLARYSATDYYSDNQGPISLASVNVWLDQHVKPDERLALICFDGLALDQWHLLKTFLLEKDNGLIFTENQVFALAPSITPISRQALFSGRRPDSFADSWSKTDRDAERWLNFWTHREIPKQRITYLPVKSGDSSMTSVVETIDSKNKRLGILVNLFDDALHAIKGMPLEADKRVLYSTLNGHLSNSYIRDLLKRLLEGGYRVFLSSDHGNTCGKGTGVLPPKAFIETYARRVAIFDQLSLAQEFAQKNQGIYFRTKSLPAAVHPVYTSGIDLFASKDAIEISHGGLSMEELVVPFIEVHKS